MTAIYPPLKGIEKDPLFDGFRRSYLNMLQVNPRLQMLANNSSSDPCAFTIYEYADIARYAPPLAKGLTCLDLVRMTMDRYLDGALAYGLVGYKSTPEYPDTARGAAPMTRWIPTPPSSSPPAITSKARRTGNGPRAVTTASPPGAAP